MSCSSRSCVPERRRVLACAGAVALAGAFGPACATESAPSAPPEVERALAKPRLQGQGRLRMFGFKVYDARLWQGAVAVPADGFGSVPLALEIGYLRELKGPQIAERSLLEMRRQRELSPAESGRWLQAMQRAFPDVKEGDRIVGVLVPEGGIRFYVNGRHTAEIPEAEFARLFVGIWLAPQTSQPALRESLLGLGGGR